MRFRTETRGHSHRAVVAMSDQASPSSTPAPSSMDAGGNRLHIPVMQERIVELLTPSLARPGALYVDGTLGLGGHAEAILTACPQARLLGIDRDQQALDLAAARLAPFGDRVRLVCAVYDQLPEVLTEAGESGLDAMLLDLGLSSLQIDQADRGFAYRVDAPLDMRMGSTDLTAADVVNTYPVDRLAGILRRYGEERFATRIARRIEASRTEEPFTTSARLVEVIASAIPAAARAQGGHPAKRTFQALRIEVNAELVALESVLPAAIAALHLHGRLAVLAYHSLEDRLVKRAFAAATSDQVPPGLPQVPDHLQAELVLLTRGALRPDQDEIAANPRATSARLRAVARIKEAA